MLATHTSGDGPNLTLVHGWGLGSGALGNIAQALGEHFTVNRVDLPGYGDSPPLEADTIEAVADELAATLPPRAMLCGWSLGAMACLVCAARYPRLVARLVLVGATASFVTREGWTDAMPTMQLDEFRNALVSDSAQLLKRFASQIHQGATQPLVAQRYLRGDDTPTANDAALLASLDLLAQSDLRPLLDTVRQPVLLVHGDADPLMPLAAAERLMMALPAARLEVFGGSAHAPFASDPARFVDSVRRFAGMLE
ncbi:MAG: alpha/beta fold hydrolase [Georgfuchsia sp.]